ncbi:tyrosine-type recombinase/integrase [Nonomuraea sp. NPDC051941]|uniref:tyrosine-type recombinase/integrase n=1 Tax=Nonomuraea sp. NPDC051941 TaxID=3364373 RepID=UPI0037C824EE
MGFSRKRIGRDGKPRYTAYYWDIKGRERSAGTFSNKKEADKEWQKAEAKVAEGRVGDPKRGRQPFERYVLDTWLPNHEMEATTRQKYTYAIHKHLIPEFGALRMVDVLPEHVRQWVTTLKKNGVTPVNIKSLMVILSAIFTTALNDQVTYLHPCKGVKTPPVVPKPLTIISPEQFATLYDALPDADVQLLVETAIETGLRWGELTELRVKDLDFASRILTVCRAVVEVNPKFHPQGMRFLVKPYPKDKEWRRFKLSAQIVRKLQAHVKAQGLGREALFFEWKDDPNPCPHLRVLPNPDSLGFTEPNEVGRSYKHGTRTAYTTGKCRCEHCRAAFAAYRAERRSKGKDSPRPPRTRDTDGHIPADWFRRCVWHVALEAAELEIAVRIHDLRHAHASWLLAGGADLQVVKERLGHASIKTTEKYLHTLDDADETALDALAKIRNRKARKSS